MTSLTLTRPLALYRATVLTNMSRVYLDNQATTPVDPRVAEAMGPYLTECFGNAHADTHRSGLEARKAVEDARRKLASAINASAKDVVFTSGATESNNLAILGVAKAASRNRNQIVTQATEHRSVLATTASLRERGFEIVTVGVDRDGIVDTEELAKVIGKTTLLVSVMLVNNETGVIQPIKEVSTICSRSGALLHSDCAQALGRIPVDVKSLGIDLASFSAHKVYGPKGIGALYIRRRRGASIEPISFGGGQEGGLRPGTLPVPLCVGFGEAARIAKAEQVLNMKEAVRLENRLWDGIQKAAPIAKRNGHPTCRAPGCMSIEFVGYRADALIDAWPDVEVAKGSACDASKTRASHVLRSMRMSTAQADSSIRMSIGRFTSQEDVDKAIAVVRNSFGSTRN